MRRKACFFLLSFLAGGLYVLGLPNKVIPHSFLLTIAGTTLAFICIQFDYVSSTRKSLLSSKILMACCFCLGQNLVGHYWIPHTLQEFGNLSPLLSYFVALLFTSIVFPQIFVFILLVEGLQRFSLIKKIRITTPTRCILYYTILMVVIENIIPQQFPIHPGLTWMSMAPYLRFAPIFGVPIYSFFSYLISFSLAWQMKERKIQYIPIILFTSFVLANLLHPLPSPREKVDESIRVNVVQPNIGNFLKLDSESGNYDSIYEVLEYYKKLSFTDEKVDLIIWPETAYPYPMDSNILKSTDLFTSPVIREIVFGTKTYLFIGGYDQNKSRKGNFKSQYNAAFLFNEKAFVDDVYHKQKLIYFGETLPFGRFNKFFSRYIENVAFFEEGQRFTEFKLPENKSFISLICYEILFPSFIRKYLNNLEERPHFMVNLTNDSWYGDTIEPYQHLFLSKWRAIEFNLPIIRSTNTGISSILYQDGSEDDRIGLGERTSKIYSIPIKKSPPTIYQQYGFCLSFLLFVLIYFLFLGIELVFFKMIHFQK